MTDAADAKRCRIRFVQHYVMNPPVKLAVATGLVPGYALLETTGRRTGKLRQTVVGVHLDDRGDAWIVAEQGKHAGYVNNLIADPHVRLRLRGRWHSGTARVVEDDDVDTRLETFGRIHARAVRQFGTDLLSVRVELEDG